MQMVLVQLSFDVIQRARAAFDSELDSANHEPIGGAPFQSLTLVRLQIVENSQGQRTMRAKHAPVASVEMYI
eukprot:3564270-Prorocentrum_lima.AAC.1